MTQTPPPARGPEVAVFGGSFDPPHVAHVLAVTWVLAATEVERVLVVPTFRHPFAKPLAPYAHRLRMCELAFADLRRAEVSRIEEELGGESRTLFTLQELGRRMPGAALRLVVGTDLLAETHKWFEFDRVRALAPLLVVGRAGFDRSDAPEGLSMPNVSSTEVRRRMRAGEPVDDLVPVAVARYAGEHGLYRSATP